jgi:chloramphenicol 3-O-phosphotransferase
VEIVKAEKLRQENEKLEKGNIVFLNGVTSSGKTSIVDAIQASSEEIYYVVANDLFEEMIGGSLSSRGLLEAFKRSHYNDVSYRQAVF